MGLNVGLESARFVQRNTFFENMEEKGATVAIVDAIQTTIGGFFNIGKKRIERHLSIFEKVSLMTIGQLWESFRCVAEHGLEGVMFTSEQFEPLSNGETSIEKIRIVLLSFLYGEEQIPIATRNEQILYKMLERLEKHSDLFFGVEESFIKRLTPLLVEVLRQQIIQTLGKDPRSIEKISASICTTLIPENVRIKIAKISAAQNGEAASLHIQNYRITDEQALVEIAKIAAAQNGRETSQYIQNYGITDPQILIEIAKIAAAQDGRGTSQYMQNYGITDQAALVEIAKIAAAQDGWGTSQYIQNYGITDLQILIEIAKIATAKDGSGTFEYIQNYGITDPQILIEIAKKIGRAHV